MTRKLDPALERACRHAWRQCENYDELSLDNFLQFLRMELARERREKEARVDETC